MPAACNEKPFWCGVAACFGSFAGRILQAGEARDERRLGELAVEAYIYLNLRLVQGCALLPAGAIKEAFVRGCWA
jgi:hypothetical protein